MIEKLDSTMQTIIALNQIEKDCFGRDAWSIPALRGEFNNEFSHFFAEVDGSGKILGYACVRILCEEAQICNIAVLTANRRLGIGSRLVERVLEFSKEQSCTRCELEVNTENSPAIGLYKKCGFSVVGVRKNFYRRNRYSSRDAYTMVFEF